MERFVENIRTAYKQCGQGLCTNWVSFSNLKKHYEFLTHESADTATQRATCGEAKDFYSFCTQSEHTPFQSQAFGFEMHLRLSKSEFGTGSKHAHVSLNKKPRFSPNPRHKSHPGMEITPTTAAPSVSSPDAFENMPKGKIAKGCLKKVTLPAPIVVRDLAKALDVRPFHVISELTNMGVFASLNQDLKDEVAVNVSKKYGVDLLVLRHPERQRSNPLGNKKDEMSQTANSDIMENENSSASKRILSKGLKCKLTHQILERKFKIYIDTCVLMKYPALLDSLEVLLKRKNEDPPRLFIFASVIYELKKNVEYGKEKEAQKAKNALEQVKRLQESRILGIISESSRSTSNRKRNYYADGDFVALAQGATEELVIITDDGDLLEELLEKKGDKVRVCTPSKFGQIQPYYGKNISV